MNPALKSASFDERHPPAWTCPNCEQGRLKLVDKFSVCPNSETANNGSEDWWDPMFAEYVFNGMLQCASCSEHVSVSGTGHVSQEYTGDGDDWEYVTMLNPKYFHPALRVISPDVSNGVPAEITELIQKAHEICWADPDSALNRLRSVVEAILDFKGVASINEKSNRIALHHRIGLFSEPGLDGVQRALMALKYVGNDGSHGFSTIKRRELLEVFSIVNYCMEKIFPIPTDEAQILELVTKINANRGLQAPASANGDNEA